MTEFYIKSIVMLEWLRHPWPWYVAGPLIGLTVPILLILGNRTFGISSSLRHVCAACMPANISFFKYEWQKEAWNLLFVGGIVLGGLLTSMFLVDPEAVHVNAKLSEELAGYGVTDYRNMVPAEVFNWPALATARGLILMVLGGFLVGFGTRYAGGCTSGHAIMGISSMQWPSVVATCCFMAGGFIMANLILPYIMTL